MNYQEIFLKLIAHLRLMSDYSQSCHHNAKGSLFFQDHEALGVFYSQLVNDFDRSAEKYVSLYGAYNFQSLVQHMSQKQLPSGEQKENKVLFSALLGLEKELSSMIEMLIKQGGYSEGCKNLISDIGTNSESRQYKINRRIM